MSANDSQEPFDLVVLGGGITGAGIARDAALRGLRVALFEKADFGSGTSSKSSKLIHGGLRYLEHGEVDLVFESVSERHVQSQVAPHLCRPLPFLVPVYEGDRWGVELLNIGLWIYDALSLFRAPRIHRTFRGRRARELQPDLDAERLRGALEYYDCYTDDARLVLENILGAQENGAVCENYTEVIDARWEGRANTISAVLVRNVLNGQERWVPTRSLVLATGPWTDEAVDTLEVKLRSPLLRPTKGVHLVFPHELLPLSRAVTLTSPVDGRVMFAIPWRERLVIGTTDTDFDGHPDRVYATAADADYLCRSVNSFFPEANLRPDQVIATWAGLRPLIHDEAEDASSVSREHRIYVRPGGVLIIAGGKLTTYRKMSAEMVDTTIDWLGDNCDEFDPTTLARCATKKRPLPGARDLPGKGWGGMERFATTLADSALIDAEVAEHLAWTYGTRAPLIVQRIAADPSLGERMQPDLRYIWAEVDFAVAEDLAQTVEDVLGRRIPLLLVGLDQGLDVAERVAERMAALLDWSPTHSAQELERYRAVVAETRLFRGSEAVRAQL